MKQIFGKKVANFFCIGCTFPCCSSSYVSKKIKLALIKTCSYTHIFRYILILLTVRSTSFHLTVLITLERYLVIVYPLRSRTWFTRTKSKFQALFIVIYVTLLFMPRYTSIYVGENVFNKGKNGMNIHSLDKFEFLFLPTTLHEFWRNFLGESFDFYLQLVEFWAPNLCLLIFNIWSVKKVMNLLC